MHSTPQFAAPACENPRMDRAQATTLRIASLQKKIARLFTQ
jgi:hypothetical protein